MMLHREALREFRKLESQNSGTTNSCLKRIQEGLLGYFFIINTISKQKRAMRRSMRKPQDLPFNRFTASITELNNHLTVFPGSSNAEKMDSEELSEILFHAVPNVRAKQSYLQGWYFEGDSYKETCRMFERREIA